MASETVSRQGNPPAFRPLTADEVTFTLSIEPEDIPIRGSFASGDDEADAQLEREIVARLDRGDNWAWCCVRVRASWGEWSADDYLGACSYDDEADFKAGGYYESMCAEALSALNATLAKDFAALAARAL